MKREQPSTISRLPKEIRAEIGRLREGGKTLDEILSHLREMHGVEVSRSALGRHTKKQQVVREAITRSHIMADALSRSFGDGKASKVLQASIELLHSMLMKHMVIIEGDTADSSENTLKPADFMLMATTLEKLSKANKTDFEQRLKEAVELARREEKTKAADLAVTAAKKSGLSKKTIEDIKAQILGIEP